MISKGRCWALVGICAGWLLAFMPLATGCGGQQLVQARPLMGEGRPPGYIGGDIPDQYRGKQNPIGDQDTAALAAGREIYRSYEPSCAACHGEQGQGNGPMAPYLEPEPANFSAPAMLAAFRDNPDYVFWWVSEGVDKTSMPAWKSRLNETQRWQVIAYARSLGENPPAPPPREQQSRRYMLPRAQE